MLALLLFAAGCAGDASPSGARQDGSPATVTDPLGNFSITSAGAGAVTRDGSVFTVSAAGEYTLTGTLDEGRVVVSAASGDEVVLILDNASVSSAEGAPFEFVKAAEVTVRAEEGSSNEVNDLRIGDPDADGENANAAIWSDCDLKLTGKGALTVSSSYDNGVKSKDDLTVKNVTLRVISPGVALKGNDGVTIRSGTLTLISTGADGVKTSNSDVSGKGNQRGDVTILGGHVDVYADRDGISAAHDVRISEDEGACELNILTASYSEYSELTSFLSEMYLLILADVYKRDRAYYYCFFNEDPEDGVWAKCDFNTTIFGGGGAAYYAMKTKVTGAYRYLTVSAFAAGTKPDEGEPLERSEAEAINRSMNGYMIDVIESGTIRGEWVKLRAGAKSTDKTTYSSKGVKADNAIYVTAGTVTISCMDDGLHAKAGETLENGATSVGDVSVSGGSVTITSADDGVHADGSISISGGSVHVVESHEGLEGNVITISGGTSIIHGKNDGINIRGYDLDPLLNITGGYVEVSSLPGDTDGIDVNGRFTMSGGVVLVKGGTPVGDVNGSVDVDFSLTVTGGTIVALGGICETPVEGSVNTYISPDAEFPVGDYAIVNANGDSLFEFSLGEAYSCCWIASDSLLRNESYRILRDGAELLAWTQNEATVGHADHPSTNHGGHGGAGR